MRILSFTTLYPNAAQPNHGVFVENRLSAVAEQPGVELRVVAPVPWFPSTSARFGTYARYAAAPRAETRRGVAITHPRYLMIPKLNVGMNWQAALLAAGARRAARAAAAAMGGVDLIDAHYLYPDGAAARRLAAEMGVPFVMTARGSDVTLLPNFPTPRREVLAAIRDASAIITVCEALRRAAIDDLGAPADKVVTLRNGVDLEAFTPQDRAPARAEWGAVGPTLVSVGGLIPRKGHHIAIEAMRDLPDHALLIAGEGEMRAELEAQIAAAGLGSRVRLLGAVPHRALPGLYSAADALVLASDREGWANVLLEAMACGTPALATAVWGAPEIIRAPAAGRLIPERTPEAIVAAVRALAADPPDRAATRAYAEGFSWDETTQGQLALFADIIAGRRRG